MQKKKVAKCLLEAPNLQKFVQSKNNKQLYMTAMSMQGWRKKMEDQLIIEFDLGDGNSVFGVLDGHNGNQVSKYLSRHFCRYLKQNTCYKEKRYKQSLISTFQTIDNFLKTQQGSQQLKLIKKQSKGCFRAFLQNFTATHIGQKTGSTANIVLITPTHFFAANAGDTRSILYKKKKIVNLSKDHKPENKEQEDRILKAGGCVEKGRINGELNISRGFGDFRFKSKINSSTFNQIMSCTPEVQEIERNPHEDQFILIGCDGLWENYEQSSRLVKQLVINLTKRSPSKSLQQLFNSNVAKQLKNGVRKGYDNMSAILIQFRTSKKNLTNSVGTNFSSIS